MPRKPPKSSEQKLERWSRSMAPGTLNGKVASATPMSLDLSRLAARLRSQPQPAAAGFDPNENPVIIGGNANSGASGTPDAPVGGSTNSVTLGPFAFTDGDYTVAIGSGADAEGIRSIAIGVAATTTHGLTAQDYAIAIGGDSVAAGVSAVSIGDASRAQGTSSVGIGASCAALADDSTAVGRDTLIGSTHTQATAIGALTHTTKAHQIMLGTTSEFTEIPGNGASNGLVLTEQASTTRWIVQVVGGVLTLNAAP